MTEDRPQICEGARDEHRWLQQLVGEWTFETLCDMGPDQPEASFDGREVMESLGDLWVVGRSEGEMSGEGTCRMQMTLGFDTRYGKFHGNFVGSPSSHMWIYEGSLDAGKTILTLDTEGPDYSSAAAVTMLRYRDVIELVDENTRKLSSSLLGANGEWTTFMNGIYRRVL